MGRPGPASALGARWIGDADRLLAVVHDRPISEDDAAVFGIIADQLAVAVRMRLFGRPARAGREQTVEIQMARLHQPGRRGDAASGLAEMRKTLGARHARLELHPRLAAVRNEAMATAPAVAGEVAARPL
jgi:hypothetical protein